MSIHFRFGLGLFLFIIAVTLAQICENTGGGFVEGGIGVFIAALFLAFLAMTYIPKSERKQ